MDDNDSKRHSPDHTNDTARWLPRSGRRFVRPRLAAAAAVVAVLALNATGAFGLNLLGLHSALTATSLPATFQSASIATYGFLAPTQTTCASFSGGSAGALGGIQYSQKTSAKPPSPVISQVNPGVFFYWVGITAANPAPTGGDVITLVETATTPPQTKNFFTMASGSGAFTTACTAVKGATPKETTGSSAAQCAPGQVAPPPLPTKCDIVTITGLTAGQTYFIGIKYSTSSVVGDAIPTGPGNTATYYFNTYQNGQLALQPKPPGPQSVQLSPK